MGIEKQQHNSNSYTFLYCMQFFQLDWGKLEK